MQFTTLLPALLSLGLANAATLAQPSIWQVTNWQIVSSGGTVYSFNISGAATANSPGFNTHCEGIVPNATACDDTNITATVTEQTHPLWNVAVTHEWHIFPAGQSEQTYWQSGSTNVSNTQSNFTITPTLFYGVA